MKNILIICIQGLTSGILARKLNMTAQQRKQEYSFRSSGVADAEKHMEWADYVILTPQVKDRLAKAEETAEKHGAECLILADTMISFQKTEETYENIVRALGDKKAPSRSDTLHSLLDTLIMISPLIAAGICAEAVSKLSGSLIMHEISCRTTGIISLYALPALGYALFRQRGESRMAGLLSGLLVLLVLTPFRHDIAYAEDAFAVSGRVAEIRYWSLPYLPFTLAAGCLFVNLILGGLKTTEEYYTEIFHRVADRNFMLFTAIPISLVMAVMLVFRTIVFSLP